MLVFDDEENEERFGLIVDGVSGVIAVEPGALEANPSGLDARSQELFDGAYKLPSGLMVHLDPQRLRPSRLAESGLFGSDRWDESGEAGGTEMRALIVDDSRFIRQYMRQLLEGMGLSCEAGSGWRRSAGVASRRVAVRFHAAGCEHAGDEWTGVREELRNAGLQPAMKVMMVTTEADHSYICQALDYGADEFLMKPFTPESLREKLAMIGLAT